VPTPQPLHPLTLVDGMWQGEPCAVLGGGPNIATVDVAAIVASMHTIAANVSAEFGPEITYCVDRHVPALIDKKGWDPGIRLVMCHGTRAGNLRAEYKNQWYHFGGAPAREWSESIAEGIGAAGGCGFYCYNLANILRADPIYLLGFDCDWSAPIGGAHWHSHYRSSSSPLEQFHDVFRRAVPHDVRKRTVILLPSRLADHPGYRTITAEEMRQRVRSSI
jgi:hypothetical protein